ncbi:hypothetical protein AURDEDRAFT_111985 [Auricularia subglabra TFB-10046 SS5]|nr:hypothetical protein AURDEDRAFT_111985 [Auricularia subglabra TFB-10046 SS5]
MTRLGGFLGCALGFVVAATIVAAPRGPTAALAASTAAAPASTRSACIPRGGR